MLYELETDDRKFKLIYDDHDSVFKFYTSKLDEFNNTYWIRLELKDCAHAIGELLYLLMDDSPERVMSQVAGTGDI